MIPDKKIFFSLLQFVSFSNEQKYLLNSNRDQQRKMNNYERPITRSMTRNFSSRENQIKISKTENFNKKDQKEGTISEQRKKEEEDIIGRVILEWIKDQKINNNDISWIYDL